MEKTISINISQQNFIIEEDAYLKLSSYLENIKRHCGVGVDATEVIADIENSMAEKLKASLSTYKELITLRDVNELIAIMGTVEDFDCEIGGDNEKAKETEEDVSDDKINRKLYRDVDNAVIGGVSSGLGNYFNIDPVIFRIIFLALVFAGGSGLLIYILLWIAMPEAKTAHQKLEMQGQAPTLSAFKNLTKAGKQIQESWKERWQNKSAFGKIINLPFVILRGIIMAIKITWQKIWPFVTFCFGLCLVVFSFIGLGLVGIASLFLILYNNSSYQILYIPISEFTNLMPYILIVSLGFLSLAIPALLLIAGGVAILRKKSFINFTISTILLGMWMMIGILFCALCLRYYPDVQNKFETHPATKYINANIDMSGVKEINASGNLDINISSSTSTPARLTGRKIEVDKIELKYEGNKLIITEKPSKTDRNICFNCYVRSVNLVIATSTDLKIIADDNVSIYDESIEMNEVIEN